MRFISTLIIIYSIWLLIKWLAKLAIRYWIVKNGGKGFQYTSGFGGQRTQTQYQDGEIKVESFGSKSQKSESNSSSQLGEYVDYEEVK